MKSEPLELPILAQSTLGAYTQLSLRWPEALPLPRAGEYLQNPDGCLFYPMLSPHPGKLEVLSSHNYPDLNLQQVSLVGKPIPPSPSLPVLIFGSGLALATLIYLCATRRHVTASTLALYQLDDPAPFRPRPSRFLLDDMPDGVIAAIPLLEDWGIPSRLCHHEFRAGCFEGSLDELVARIPKQPERQMISLTNTQ